MKREIKRLEIKEGIYLDGPGILEKVLPMRFKDIPMRMYFDSTYPSMVIIECGGHEHFLSIDNVKSGTFAE